MTTYDYDTTVPAANHAPKNDQPQMQTNAASISGLIGVDHVGFNTPNGGAHARVQLLNVSGGSGTIPSGLLGNGYETLYSSSTAGEGDVWFVRGSSPTGIQLTGPGTPTISINGSTFLPGGLILNWGTSSVNTVGSSTDISFTQSYTSSSTVYSITIGCINTQGNSPSANNIYIKSGTVTASGFKLTNSSSGGTTSVYWMAIGS